MIKWNSFIFIQKTAFHYAIEKGNTQIVQLLLLNENIDINIKSVNNYILFYLIPLFHYNRISY